MKLITNLLLTAASSEDWVNGVNKISQRMPTIYEDPCEGLTASKISKAVDTILDGYVTQTKPEMKLLLGDMASALIPDARVWTALKDVDFFAFEASEYCPGIAEALSKRIAERKINVVYELKELDVDRVRAILYDYNDYSVYGVLARPTFEHKKEGRVWRRYPVIETVKGMVTEMNGSLDVCERRSSEDEQLRCEQYRLKPKPAAVDPLRRGTETEAPTSSPKHHRGRRLISGFQRMARR